MAPVTARLGVSVNRRSGIRVGLQRDVFNRSPAVRSPRPLHTRARREPKLEVHCASNPIGVHALTWVGGWSEKECRHAASQSAKLGYDLVEVCAREHS
eukprot:5546488-Pyramimonas_sp.AAC.2